jgi:putative oxidoreductase
MLSTARYVRRGTLTEGVDRLLDKLACAAYAIGAPLARIALAVPFLRSGMTKWSGFLRLSPTAAFLFEDEFKLHLFGHLYAFPFPEAIAWADGIAEIVLPCLLIAGLATRLSALGLLTMTMIIQLTVPEGWANFHLPWAALAVAIIALGPGRASLDFWIKRAFSDGANPTLPASSG